MKISIVMPVYQLHPIHREMTDEAIQNLEWKTENPYELIIVTHGDPPKYELHGRRGLKFTRRITIGKAYNEGFSIASGDIFVCMHNDVVVGKKWDVNLARAAENGNIAFPMVDEFDSRCEERGIRPTEPWQTTGCCFAMSREVWDSLGGFDEDYGMYHWEDTDLFSRAEEMKIPLVRVNTTVVHYRGATRSFVLGEDKGNLLKGMNRFRNKHGGERKVPRISEKPQEV